MIQSPLIRKTIALTLVATIVVGFWSILLTPLLVGLTDDKARIAQSRRLLERYDQLAAELPKLQERLRALTAVADDRDFLLGNNQAVVTAELQTKVRTLVDAAGVTVRSSQTVPPHEENGFNRFALQLDLTTSPEGLRRLLYAMETATPILFAEKLSIRVPENASPRPDSDPQNKMAIHLEVAGYQPAARS